MVQRLTMKSNKKKNKKICNKIKSSDYFSKTILKMYDLKYTTRQRQQTQYVSEMSFINDKLNRSCLKPIHCKDSFSHQYCISITEKG